MINLLYQINNLFKLNHFNYTPDANSNEQYYSLCYSFMATKINVSLQRQTNGEIIDFYLSIAEIPENNNI